jgi:hypothetical protein
MTAAGDNVIEASISFVLFSQGRNWTLCMFPFFILCIWLFSMKKGYVLLKYQAFMRWCITGLLRHWILKVNNNLFNLFLFHILSCLNSEA